MNKRSTVLAFLFLIPMLARANDRYVALSTGLDLWIMKIDTEGKVLDARRQQVDYFTASVGISPVSTGAGTALAVFKTENAVDVTKIESALFQHEGFSEFQDFGGRVLSEAGVLQVTQKPSANWLLARSVFSHLYQALGINAQLQWNGTIKTVSPVLPGAITAAAVSSDGRMLIESVTTPGGGFQVIAQPLSADGSRRGSPVVSPLPDSASALDCSNSLNDGTRWLVYRLSHAEGIDEITSQVFLQRINSASGKQAGVARSITRTESRIVTLRDLPQSVAIDPQSRFVLYSAAGECGKKVLKFQSLDAAEGVSMAPKVIFGCGRVSNTQAGVESVDVSMGTATGS